MRESDVTSEVTNLLKRLWLWPHKDSDLGRCSACGNRNYPKGGHPDIQIRNAPLVIEVKVFKHAKGKPWATATFPFASITKEQHVWLDMWVEDGLIKGVDQQAYLALGTTHGRAGAKVDARRLWLIPWEQWVDYEADMLPYRKTLPLAGYKGQRPGYVREYNMNAVSWFEDFELEWHTGQWHLPETAFRCHPFSAELPEAYSRYGERNLKGFYAHWEVMGDRYDKKFSKETTSSA
jgi:hypothetical protein